MAGELNLETYQKLLAEDSSQEPSLESYMMLLNQAPPRGAVANARYTGQAAMIAGSPYELEALHVAAASGDTKLYRSQQAMNWYDERIQDAHQHLQQTQFGSAEVMLAAAQLQSERISSIEAGKAHPLSEEVAYATNAAYKGDPEAITREAVDIALANEISELAESTGIGEKIVEFGSFLIPFKYAADIADIDDQIRDNPELAEIAGEDIESVVGAWKALPPERQLALVGPLKDAIMKATESFGWTDGNALKTASLLTQFFEVDPSAEINSEFAEDVVFGLVDATPVGAIRGLRPVEKLRHAKILRKVAEDAAADTGAAKVATRAGDSESAAKHTVASLVDDNTAAALGTTREDAAASALPIETSEWFTRVVDDDALPAAVADEMNNMFSIANGFARTLKEESGLMQVGLLNRSERNQVVQSFFEKMEDVGEEYLTEGMHMDNLKLVDEDAKGFTYQYTLRDKSRPVVEGEKERFIVRSGKVKFSINDVTGTYSATVEGASSQNFFANIMSPAAWSRRTAEGDFNLEVKRALQSDDLSTAYQDKVGAFLDWATEPVSGITQGKARERVSAVLQAGDEWVNPQTHVEGTVYSPTELAAGINTPMGKVHLTDPREVEAYYRYRLYGDATFINEDFVLRREKELAGMKDIKLQGLEEGGRAIGKPFDNTSAALASVRDKRGQGVWDSKVGRTVDITDDYVRSVYDEGDVLVRLEKDWNTKGTGELDRSGEFVQYARVQKDAISEMPDRILNYRAGYVPKINEARFVVSQRMPKIARGRPNLSSSQALRAFDSLQDAKLFREEQVVRWMEKNGSSRADAEQIFPEVDLLDEGLGATRLEEAVGAHTGLYHGVRSKDKLLFGLSGQELSRVNPLEAFQRHSRHLGSFISQNEVRIGREKRWLNTVRQEFPDIDIKGFDNTALPSTPKGRAAERVRRVIREWNGIPTREEELADAMWQRVHDWALNGVRRMGYADKESVKSVQWLRQKNPYALMKTIVMHNLLGVFNPAQLYTQASAMSVAIGKFPAKFAARTINDVAWMHVLDNIVDDTMLGKVYNILLNGKAIDETTKATYDAFRRTGLKEAVFNNSDMARISSHGLGVTRRFLSVADNLSLTLYRSGELAARRATFAAEFGAWSRRTGKKVPSDLELSEILEEVNKDLLELGPANRAYWQGGNGTGDVRQMLGVATQFMQVGAKTIELVAKGTGRGGFSAAQKRRILFSQLAMFGAAGVPLGGLITQAITSGLGIEELPHEVAELGNQGFVGLMGRLMFGDVEVSDRFALGAQTTQMIEDFITAEDPFWVKAFGPAGGGVLGRAWDSFQQLRPLMVADWGEEGIVTEDGLKLAASILGEIPSSGRNWMKFWIMKNHHAIIDQRKRVLIDASDRGGFDSRTELGRLLGFTPTAEQNMRMLQLDQKAVDEMIQEYANYRVQLMHKAIWEFKLDPQSVVAIEEAYKVMDRAVPKFVASKGRDLAVKKIYGPRQETKEEELVKKFLERTAVDKISEDFILDSNAELGTAVKPLSQPFKNILGGSQVPQEED